MRFPRSRSCLSRWVIYLLFSSQLPRRDYREDKIFAPKSVRRAYSSSYKDANVESSEKNENRDKKYRTLTAVVDPNCAIDILSMCIMWLDIIKVKIPESFFFFLLLLLSWPRNKKSCCWSFRMSHVVKTTGDWKKAKKIYTQSPFTSTVPTYSRKFPSSSSCFSEGTSSSQQLEYWTDRTNSL